MVLVRRAFKVALVPRLAAMITAVNRGARVAGGGLSR